MSESSPLSAPAAAEPVDHDGRQPPELESLFHPAVAAWFARRFPAGPTPPQSAAWPHIAAGRDVLVASPTGSGKTLTGFLVAIDAAYRAAEAGTRTESAPEVLYISPLRALAVDVHENLHVPLAEIRAEADRLGCPDPGLRVAVRTGDTPPAERAAMRRRSPDLLVTTPESLYLLLTAPSSRALLRGVRTVIVDEVHTLARDKRGSHLSLSLERLDALVTRERGPAPAHRTLGHPAAPRARGPPPYRRPPGTTAGGHRRLRPRAATSRCRSSCRRPSSKPS